MKDEEYYNKQWSSFARQVYHNLIQLKPAIVKVMSEHKGVLKKEEIIGLVFSQKLVEQADDLRSQVHATIEARRILDSLDDPS